VVQKYLKRLDHSHSWKGSLVSFIEAAQTGGYRLQTRRDGIVGSQCFGGMEVLELGAYTPIDAVLAPVLQSTDKPTFVE